MPRFCANLTTMFREFDFLDRFDAAADAGFDAVECQFPYEVSPDAIAVCLKRAGQDFVMFNTPPGNRAAGDLGFAAVLGREKEFRASFGVALEYAAATGVRQLHVLAGFASSSDRDALARFKASLSWASEQSARSNIRLLIEPINQKDFPGYFLGDFEAAVRILEDIADPNISLLFDTYHLQLMQVGVIAAMRQFLPKIGHVQVSSIPNRAEPRAGDVEEFGFFRELDRLGYTGCVGCEYSPANGTLEGLDWLWAWRAQTSKPV